MDAVTVVALVLLGLLCVGLVAALVTRSRLVSSVRGAAHEWPAEGAQSDALSRVQDVARYEVVEDLGRADSHAFGHALDGTPDGRAVFVLRARDKLDQPTVTRYARGGDAVVYSGAAPLHETYAWHADDTAADNAGLRVDADGRLLVLWYGRRAHVVRCETAASLYRYDMPGGRAVRWARLTGGYLVALDDSGALHAAPLNAEGRGTAPLRTVAEGVDACAAGPGGRLVLRRAGDRSRMLEVRASDGAELGGVPLVAADRPSMAAEVSASGLHLAVGFPGDGIHVYHRAHVDDPWLRSSAVDVAPRHQAAGRGPMLGYGAVLRFVSDEYLVVGGLDPDVRELDFVYLNAVTGAPRYFFTVDCGAHPPGHAVYASSPDRPDGYDGLALVVGSTLGDRQGATFGRARVFRTTYTPREVGLGDEPRPGEAPAPACLGHRWHAPDAWSTANPSGAAVDARKDMRLAPGGGTRLAVADHATLWVYDTATGDAPAARALPSVSSVFHRSVHWVDGEHVAVVRVANDRFGGDPDMCYVDVCPASGDGAASSSVSYGEHFHTYTGIGGGISAVFVRGGTVYVCGKYVVASPVALGVKLEWHVAAELPPLTACRYVGDGLVLAYEADRHMLHVYRVGERADQPWAEVASFFTEEADAFVADRGARNIVTRDASGGHLHRYTAMLLGDGEARQYDRSVVDAAAVDAHRAAPSDYERHFVFDEPQRAGLVHAVGAALDGGTDWRVEEDRDDGAAVHYDAGEDRLRVRRVQCAASV